MNWFMQNADPGVAANRPSSSSPAYADEDAENKGEKPEKPKAPKFVKTKAEHVRNEKWGGWAAIDFRPIQIRGPNYLTERVKIPTRAPIFYLQKVEVLSSGGTIPHISQRSWSWLSATHEKRKEAMRKLRADSNYVPKDAPKFSSSIDENDTKRLRIKDPDFIFVVNFIVPGNINFVCYLVRNVLDEKNECFTDNTPDKQLVDTEDDPNFDRAFERFIHGTEEFRHQKFKLIPTVVDGNYFVKTAVGNRPAIVGMKLTQKYFWSVEKNYFEVDIDVSSSQAGNSLFYLTSSYARHLVIDLTFLIESQEQDELPERVMGGVRCINFVLSEIDKADHTKD